MGMSKTSNQCARIPECGVSVPVELGSVGLCIYHFTRSVESTCADMHREIVICRVTPERGTEVSTYIGECATLLARVISNRCLPDDLKKRILCSFVSLMNLRESLDRIQSIHAGLRAHNSNSVLASARVTDRFN